MIAERLDLLEEESRTRVMRVWPVLQAAEEKRSGLSAAQWVERTWRSLGGDASLTPEELGNARRYLQLLDEMEEDAGTTDVSLLKRRLDKLFAQPAGGGWAVDLMTIHKSKGLEWDVVMVPGLQKKDPADRERLLTWSEIDSEDTEAAHIMLAPIAGRGEGSKALNDWLRGIDKAKKAAERKRVFYVACTRAREELHLFASPETTARGDVVRPPGSLLATAWPAAGRYFTVGAPASQRLIQLPMMFPKAEEEESFIGEIAAAADEATRPTMLQRLPMGFRPESRFSVKQQLSYGEDAIAPGAKPFERPEGSFEARAFGNAVHAFLEVLAKKLADGAGIAAVLHEVAGWTPRIASVLRGDGLPPAVVERLVPRVRTALSNMLQDDEGRWVLSQHKQAANELSLNAWNDAPSSVRLDRVFYSGAEPMHAGADYLWIIDYKTAAHGREGLEGFFAEERLKYGEQMKAYARMMRDRVEDGRLRVGLYYPMLPKLVWWEPERD